MAIPKKGTRQITVDGVVYRWIIAPNDEPGLGIVVECKEYPRQRIIAWIEHGNIVSPKIVRQAILYALAIGWQPQKIGRTIEFRFNLPLQHTNSSISQLSIRNYQNSDLSAIENLHRLALENDSVYGYKNKFSQDLDDVCKLYFASKIFIVGAIEDRIIATGAIRKLSSDKIEINQMLVHPDSRRLGYGQQILEYLEMQAVKMGITTFSLHTRSTQIAARKPYIKNGFVEIKRQPWRKMERIYFEKRSL